MPEKPAGMEKTITSGGTPFAFPGLLTPAQALFQHRDRYQPYIKLDGSSN
jgi:hypothetical protein